MSEGAQRSSTNHHAEFVIIGAGISGALLAAQLSKAGRDVLVLEAGPREERSDIFARALARGDVDYLAPYPNLSSAPIPGTASHEDGVVEQVGPDALQPNYLRLVGGTTWHWGAASIRMAPDDFQMQSLYGLGVDWPINQIDLVQYYQQAEREMGVCGPIDQSRPWLAETYPLPPQTDSYLDRQVMQASTSIDLEWIRRPLARNSIAYDNRPQCHGHSNCTPICPIGAQYAAIFHIEEAERAGARLIENANVQLVKIGDDQEVDHVVFRRPDGSLETVHGTTFILAANAVEGARLLLNSLSEATPNGVANTSGQVGRYLMNHPTMDFQVVSADPVYAGRGPHSSIISVHGLASKGRREESAYQIALQSRNRPEDAAMQGIQQNLLGEELHQAIRQRTARQFQLITHVEDLPEERNRMTLSHTERDAAGMPKIKIDYAMNDYAKRGMATAAKKVQSLMTAMGGSITNQHVLDDAVHLMGTTRMGANAAQSVTNADLQSHQHSNLYLTGSSVFPTGGIANPTLTIAALSLRLADRLIGNRAG